MGNLKAGRGNVAIALTTKTWEQLGFNNTNLNIIYEVGNQLLSWVPDRLINNLNGITTGNQYWIVPKIELDYPNDFLTDLNALQGNVRFLTMFKVGSGGEGVPVEGDTEYTNPLLSGKNILVTKSGKDYLTVDDDYTFAGEVFTLTNEMVFSTGEVYVFFYIQN